MNEGSGEQAKGTELQFDKVDVAVPGALRVCSRCQARLEHEYFEAEANFICPACARAVRGDEEGGAFPRALAYGIGAALLGTLVWFLIIKLTEREFGLIAIGVGLLVGYAVKRGARGRGGWRYQALALALTYVSITASYVPLVIKSLSETEQTDKSATGVKAGTPEAAPAPAPKEAEAPPSLAGVAVAFLILFAIALASPFLSGFENIMGLIIIAIALYEAWKLNRRVVVTGPYQIRTDPVAAPS